MARKSSTLLTEMPTWTEHRVVCGPCIQVKLKRPGGHKKKKSPGRPKADLNCWTLKLIENVLPKSNFPVVTPPDIPQQQISNSKQLDLCKCSICANIISKPVMTAKC